MLFHSHLFSREGTTYKTSTSTLCMKLKDISLFALSVFNCKKFVLCVVQLISYCSALLAQEVTQNTEINIISGISWQQLPDHCILGLCTHAEQLSPAHAVTPSILHLSLYRAASNCLCMVRVM